MIPFFRKIRYRLAKDNQFFKYGSGRMIKIFETTLLFKEEKYLLMKNAVLVSFFLFLSLFLKAQTNLDSLLTVWQDDNLQDTTRLNALHTILSDVVFHSNKPDSALVLAELMYDMADENDLRKYKAAALNHKGWCMGWKYDNEKALAAFEQGLKLFAELDDNLGLANSYLGMGSVYIEKGDYSKSQEYLSKALMYAEESGNKERISRILHFSGSSYFSSGNEPAALEQWERGYALAKEDNNKYQIAMFTFNLGNILAVQGNYLKALDNYERANVLLEELGDSVVLPTIISNMGGIYSFIENYPKAIEYLHRSIELSKEQNDMSAVAWSTAIIADNYIVLKDYDNALKYTDICYKIAMESGDSHGKLMALRAYAHISARKNDFEKAIEFSKQGLQISEETNDFLIRSFIYELLGKEVYLPTKQFTKALDHCNKALELYENSGALLSKRDACECIYRAYKGMGKLEKALEFYERFQVLNDSLQIEEAGRKFQEMEYEKITLIDSIARVEKELLVQQANDDEVRKKNRTKNIAIGGGLLFMILAGGFFSRSRYIKKSRDVIAKEKDRSENLLLNILPAEIAEELKSKGKADARNFDNVSILFTDFKSFTEASAKLSAQDLVSEINVCFEVFDGIMGKYGIEKIKTIGDAYMAAGGLPVPSKDSLKNTVLAALEMQAFISKRKVEMDAIGKHSFQMRAGVHTGSVVAGIVGVKKFQYDIWGDAVNTASRIESKGEVGKVNISKHTYELIKDDQQFTFEKRGKIKAKGKGEIEMYFVEKSTF